MACGGHQVDLNRLSRSENSCRRLFDGTFNASLRPCIPHAKTANPSLLPTTSRFLIYHYTDVVLRNRPQDVESGRFPSDHGT